MVTCLLKKNKMYDVVKLLRSVFAKDNMLLPQAFLESLYKLYK